ncbi:hypothetical protein WJX72_009742 [[Myrmecia] bisecta]|uniref:Ergosterol biosynthetic protein 28 n=1 Tax=[Myrmecia] bisecta TaxID=41462 RepID=A0AAW1Q7L9_9CHLO
MPSVTALRRWLVFVALLRLLSVYLGFFQPKRLATNLFDKAPEQVTDLYGRTFATWTTVTCALCLLCARNPRVPAIYGATLFSFAIALVHFASELLFFETISLVNALQPMFFAAVSVLWMGAGWNYYTSLAATETSEDQVTSGKLE